MSLITSLLFNNRAEHYHRNRKKVKNDQTSTWLRHWIFFCLLTFTVLGSMSSYGQLAAWTFDATADVPSTPNSLAANLGSQSGTAFLYANGTNGSSSWITATSGNELRVFPGATNNDPRGGSAVAGKAYALLGGTGNSANGKSMVAKFSMTGFQDPILTYSTQTSSASGFTSQTWAWSTDNITYTNLASFTSLPTSFATKTVNLTAVNAVDNAATVYLRVTFTGATNSTSNNRLDNIVVNASTLVQPPVVTSATLNGTVGTTFPTYQVSGTNSPIISYAITGAGSLPPGLSFNTTSGQVTGTPSTFGNYSIDVNATNSAGTSASPGTISFNIAKGNQAIANFPATDTRTYTPTNQQYNLNATGGGSGNAVTYASSNTNVATVSGSQVTVVGAGTTNITASQAGNSNYNAAPDSVQVLTVNKASQTISFGSLPDKYDNAANFQLTATSSSGLTVTYTSSQTTVCQIVDNLGAVDPNGSYVDIIAAGQSTITASQTGNANYLPATSVQQLQTILNFTLQPQVINFGALSNVTYGDAPLELTATGGGSGNPIVYTSSNTAVGVISDIDGNEDPNGSFVKIIAPGTTTITANQAGDGTYNAASPVSRGLTVDKKHITVNGAIANDKPYDGTNAAVIDGGSLEVIVPGDDVTFSGAGTFGGINAGSYTVTANFTLSGADAGKYILDQPTYPNINITQLPQNITFNALPDKSYGDNDFTLTATGGASGNPVTFTSSNTAVATVTGNTVHIAGPGTTQITASQAGSTNYSAAADVVQQQLVNPGTGPQIVKFDLSTLPGGTNNFGPSPLTQTSKDPNVTIVGLTRGSGIGTTGSGSAKAWGGNAFSGTTSANAISTSQFVTFSITASTGYTVSLNGIPVYNIKRSSTGPTTGLWQYKVGSGSFVDLGSPITWGAITTNVGNDQPAIDLTGIPALQNVTAGTTINFRVVLWGATGSAGTWYFNDLTSGTRDLIVTGTTNAVVPPSNPPVVSNASLNGNVGTAFTAYQVIATNTPVISYAIAGGSLPTGLSFNTSSGQVTGTPTLAGSYSINVNATNAAGTSVIPGTISFSIGLANQAIANFPATDTRTYTSTLQQYNLAATGGASGNPVTYASSNTNVATVSGNQVTIVGAGTANITASQAGDANYNPAPDSVQVLTVNKAAQTIVFAALTPKTVGNADFTLNGTGGASGNPVTYTSSNTAVATVTGNLVHILGAGTTQITASQAGNANYNAATDVIQSQLVNPPAAPLIVKFDLSTMPGGANNFGPSPLAFTARDANVSIVGLTRGSAISTIGTGSAKGWGGTGFSGTTAANAISTNQFVSFSITANAGYAVSLSGIPVYNIRRSGTGPTTGLWQYQIGSGSFFDIGSAITWGGTTSSTGNDQPAIDLSGISALQNVSAGTSITFRLLLYGATGTGGTWYFNDQTSGSRDLIVNGTAFLDIPPVNPPVVSNATLNGTYAATLATYQVSATNTPILSYSIVNGTLPPGLALNTTTGQITGMPAAAGSYSIDVNATNSAGTSSVPGTISFTIAKANQSIANFPATGSRTYTATTQQFNLSATGGASGNPVTYASDNAAVATISGNQVTVVGAGTANITASQAGNANFNAAPDSIEVLTVNQASQSITFAALPAKTNGDADFTLTATGGASGNPVSFSSSNTSVATITGNLVHIVGAGTTQITASQAGNTNYSAAPDVVRTLTVNAATLGQIVKFDLSTLTGGTNNFGASPLTPTSSHPNTSIVGLTRGVGIGTTATSSPAGWGGTGFVTANNTQALAESANQVVTFSITANPGYAVSLTNMPVYNIRRSSTGPTNGIWQYQVGAGAFNNIGNSITWGGVTSASGNDQPAIDLTGIAALQNVPEGTPITLRLVLWGSTGTGGTWYFNDQVSSSRDLIVNGTIDQTTPPVNPPVVSSATLNGTYGTVFTNYQVVATNPTISSYTIVNGVLPPGLSFNTLNGRITGTPTIPGTYSVDINASNAAGTSSTPGTISITIAKAGQSIANFPATDSRTYASTLQQYNLAATGGASGNPVTYASSNTNVATISGNQVTIVGGGTSNITASQAGNAFYNPAPDSIQVLTVNKATQTITFATLPGKSVGDADFTLTATGGASGNPITFASSDNAVATVTGSLVHITGAGTTTITASQAGNSNYNAAANVANTLTVTQPILAAWDFNSVTTPGVATYATAIFNSNLNSSNRVTRGDSAAISPAVSSFRTVGFKNDGISVNNKDYFQATFSTTAGKVLSFSNINAKFNGTTTYYASPGVTSQFAYSLDGTNFTLIGSPVTSTSLTMATIDLTGVAALQNVPAGTTVTMRYYASGRTSTGGWGFYSGSFGDYGLSFGGSVTATGCQGTPASSTITGAVPSVCSGTALASDLSLSTSYTDADISYQWASSSVSGGPYTNLLGTAATQPSGVLTANTYYVCTITCMNTMLSFTTPEKAIIVNPIPTVSFSGLASTYCSTDPAVTLISNQNGGSFFGAGITDNGNGTASFNPLLSGTGGPYTIRFTYTDMNGCSSSNLQQTSVRCNCVTNKGQR